MTPRRPLVGPVSTRFAAEQLGPARRQGTCLTFGQTGTDVAFRPGDTWSDLTARLPAGWTADLVILNLAYTTLPVGWERATLSLVGYGADWPLHWHYYRRLAPHLDRLWIDSRGTELFTAAGLRNVRTVVPFGRPTMPSELDSTTTPARGGNPPAPPSSARGRNPPAPPSRDLDLTWVGNFNVGIHHDRNRWVTRIARLGERYNVRIAPTLDLEQIRPLFARTRVAFLPSFHGAWDGLVGEALAAGAVVVRDGPVSEVPGGFKPGSEYVPFTDGDLEETLERLLTDEPRRRAIAAAGQARAVEFGTENLWTGALAELDGEWEQLTQGVARRSATESLSNAWELAHWQALGSRGDGPTSKGGETEVGERLATAVRLAWGGVGTQKPRMEAVPRLRELLDDPNAGTSAALHLAELLTELGQPTQALAPIRQVMEAVSGRTELSPLTLGFGPLRPGFDSFRVAWERAGWSNPDDPSGEADAKRKLLHAGCELLLGQVTADPARILRAAQVAPDYLPAIKAAGRVATRVDGPLAAVPLLARALSADPFEKSLASELETALHAVGDAGGLEQLRRDRQLLSRARGVSPAPPARVPAVAARQHKTLTMIVKNEMQNLPRCLDSAQDLVDDVVLVDTGSTDGTAEFAASRGARVIPFTWRDDFAAARNAALDVARGEWIFWLDADEWLAPADRDRLRRVFAGLKNENAAYLMRQLSPSMEPGGATTAVDQVRLFRNRLDVRWEYRIHEQIMLSVRRTNAIVRTTDVVITHSGYNNAALRDQKLARNTRLLEIAHREAPADPILAFNLAWVYHKVGRSAEVVPLLEHCRAVLSPQVSIVPKVYRVLAQSLARLGRTVEAQETFATGRRLYADDVELLLHHGLFLQTQKDYPQAEACFRRILTLPPGTYSVGIDLSLLGYKTRNALAELLLEQGRLVEAEQQWRIALTEEPRFPPGHVGLATIALARGHRAQATEILDQLGTPDPVVRPQVERLRKLLANDNPNASR